MHDTASPDDGMSRASPPPPAAAAPSTTPADLSVITHRDEYIDNNLTQIDDATPKHFTYLHDNTQPDAAAAAPDLAAFHRLQSRVSALEQENRRWVDQYQLACRQNQSLQAHIQLMLHDRSSVQPPSPSSSIALSSSVSSTADLSPPPRPSSPAPARSCPHPRDSLFHAVLLENGVLLDRYDSLQRRCRLQEHMIEHRNATLTQLQRALIHHRETVRRQRYHQQQQQQQQQQQAATAAAEARDSAQSSARPSRFHSRQSSTASNCSERSAEQLVDDIEALLTRQPRLFIATSPPAPLSPSQRGKAEAEETKQQDDETQRRSAGGFSARITASTASSAQRRSHRPTLTVSHSQSASRQLSPGLPPHPVHRSPPHSAASPSASHAAPSAAVKAKASRVTAETEATRSKQRTKLSATTPLATSPRSPASPASPVPAAAGSSRTESRRLE